MRAAGLLRAAGPMPRRGRPSLRRRSSRRTRLGGDARCIGNPGWQSRLPPLGPVGQDLDVDHSRDWQADQHLWCDRCLVYELLAQRVLGALAEGFAAGATVVVLRPIDALGGQPTVPRRRGRCFAP